MAGSRARPPVSTSSSNDETELKRLEAAQYIASLLEGLRVVAHKSELPFLAYRIGVALEEANNENSQRG